MIRLLLVCILLSGCAPQLLKGSGEITVAPSGYSVECAAHPELENCK